MNCITTSIFDIFKIGPGPSSSHTIGPMKAANTFMESANQQKAELINSVEKVKVRLFGSLSATGQGHGTDKAIAAGLLGHVPETCNPDEVLSLLPDKTTSYMLKILDKEIPFCSGDIFFENNDDCLKFQNTMVLELVNANNEVAFSKTYYSIGGGFIRCEGQPEPEPPMPPHIYANLRQFKHVLRRTGQSPIEVLLENEKAISGLSENEINKKLDTIIATMDQAVINGLNTSGVLPGKIGLERKAGDLYKRAQETIESLDRYLLLMNAFGMAASEENAAGRIVVTAPTSGASGVIPGIIHFLKNYAKVDDKILREGLMIASLIASVAKHNASISGAEVGCQGEVGVASAMAAALLAHVNGCDITVIDNAAESALEHHLGMTCDPIGGYVQIPCIERNAVGAIAAYNAYLLTSGGNPNKHKLTFDEVVAAMLETGRDMCNTYKETSRGGLAVCSLRC